VYGSTASSFSVRRRRSRIATALASSFRSIPRSEASSGTTRERMDGARCLRRTPWRRVACRAPVDAVAGPAAVVAFVLMAYSSARVLSHWARPGHSRDVTLARLRNERSTALSPCSSICR